MQSLFESERLTFESAIDLTAASLWEHGATYRHWAVAFSGGKDSTLAVTLLVHLLENGRVPRPETLTVLYADTRMELPPLQASAMKILEVLERRGIRTQVVLPELDDRFYVYMFGRGVPPPKNRFRWCTPMLKVEPMLRALKSLRDQAGEKLLMLTGVRVGESAARDQRIALSCGKDGAECGQGWFQESTPESIADTLAPCLHWRVCHVVDWLMGHAPRLGFDTFPIAQVYRFTDHEEGSPLEVATRTGCVGCNLVGHDRALDQVLAAPEWAYLAPLKRLRPLYQDLQQFKWRLQKNGERNKGGELSANPMRKGPLTMEAREMGLFAVLAIQEEVNAAAQVQGRPEVSLINAEEKSRILELIAANTWPNKWTGDEPVGDELLPEVRRDGTVQGVLFQAMGE